MPEKINLTNETPSQQGEKIFKFGDYRILLRKNNLGIDEKETKELDDQKTIVKTMLKEILTVDTLRIMDKNGRFITEEEYDNVRKELWEKQDKTDSDDYEEIVSALTYNDLSFGSKVSGVNFAINTLLDPENEAAVTKEQKEKLVEIKKQFNELIKKVSKENYAKMEIEKKENFMKELNDLALKLYDLI